MRKTLVYTAAVAILVGVVAAGYSAIRNDNRLSSLEGNNALVDSDSLLQEFVSATSTPDYMYLFTSSDAKNDSSHIEGYVPEGLSANHADWIPQKWTVIDGTVGGEGLVVFTPKESVPFRDFSDITLNAMVTNGTNSALRLAEREMSVPVQLGTTRTKFIEKSPDGSTDVYHVEKILEGSCDQKFFFDKREGLTVVAHFAATSPNCQKYSARVKDFIKIFSNHTTEN